MRTLLRGTTLFLGVIAIVALIGACDRGPGAKPPPAAEPPPTPPAVGITTDRALPAKGDVSHYRIRLKIEPSGPVTITISGAEDTDFSVSPSLLTFTQANYNDFQRVTVSAVENGTTNRLVSLKHSAAGGGYDKLESCPIGTNKPDCIPNVAILDSVLPTSQIERELAIDPAQIQVDDWEDEGGPSGWGLLPGAHASIRLSMEEFNSAVWYHGAARFSVVFPGGSAVEVPWLEPQWTPLLAAQSCAQFGIPMAFSDVCWVSVSAWPGQLTFGVYAQGVTAAQLQAAMLPMATARLRVVIDATR